MMRGLQQFKSFFPVQDILKLLLCLLSATQVKMQCNPCPKGEERVSAQCVPCSPCQPGYYKVAVSLDACTACPADTFNAEQGAQDPSTCTQCPMFATTEGRRAQTSQLDCVCGAQHYSVFVNSSLTCPVCPKGLACLDGSCALQNSPLLSCPGDGRIVGDWKRDNISGQYELVGCPAGYSLRSTQVAGSQDLQECQACLASQYILNPDTDACQPCPPGLRCTGADAAIAVVANSTWVRNGTIYQLMSCPVGYSVLSGGATGKFDAAVQQCIPCPKGEECVSAPCIACSPCQPGYYKPTTSADACISCPSNTYNPLQHAQDQSVCKQCPKGALCSDGSCALHDFPYLLCSSGEKIIGSWTLDNSSGQYRLDACPAGYVQNADQCQRCVTSFYCPDGGTATPCASGQYSLPGSSHAYDCFPCVFVVMVINFPFPRNFLDDTLALQLQQGLANLAGVDPVFVVIGAIQGGDNGNNVLTTDVAPKIATFTADAADALSRKILETYSASDNGFIYTGSKFFKASLLSVKVTACVSGYELQSQPPPSACSICLPHYFCAGGTTGRALCPGGGFSVAGANTSDSCVPFAASILIEFPVSIRILNVNSTYQHAILRAIALAAGVAYKRLCIISITETRRAGSDSTQVHSEVPTKTIAEASAILRRLDASILNKNLLAEGIDQCLHLSANVISSLPSALSSSSGPLSTSEMIGSAIGSFFFLLLLLIAGYVFAVMIMKQRAHRSFVAAFMKYKPGDVALRNALPSKLNKYFVAERILGKGSNGCVVKAKKSGTERYVAIKIILPEKGIFDEKELRRLNREATILELFTSKKCEHAVNLVASTNAVEIRGDLCWFILEYLDGKDMAFVMSNGSGDGCNGFGQESPNFSRSRHLFKDLECIKMARCVLAALKLMHSEGVIHRDVQPANIVCIPLHDGLSSFSYKLIDFGTALGVDETLAKEAMKTLAGNRALAVGTPPYMSPEMFKEPEKAAYSTDIWSLGVTMYEAVTARLPFQANSELLWCFAVAGDMDEKAPSVLDVIEESERSTFDHNLSKVISTAIEKKIQERYASADEMHEAVYSCLIIRGEACYSAFISYRVASEAPLARLLFDELNHSVTPGGHRVTVYWDAHRLVKGEDWEEGFASGLLNSLCFLPLLSYGSTAPLASFPVSRQAQAIGMGWEATPIGRQRIDGAESDVEDNVLKELMIAAAILELSKSGIECMGKAQLQMAYPILVGRQEPEGHPDYPRMGNFFAVQGGGGRFPDTPSPATARAVAGFLRDKAGFSAVTADRVQNLSVKDAVAAFTRLQGCHLWNHPKDLKEVALTKEQKILVGKGYAGPPVVIDDFSITNSQVK